MSNYRYWLEMNMRPIFNSTNEWQMMRTDALSTYLQEKKEKEETEKN